MARLGRTIPGLPVLDLVAAVVHYRDWLGFTVLHQDDGFAALQRDAARLHLWRADVHHPVSRHGVPETDFGTREFATLDHDGNLIEFFHSVHDPEAERPQRSLP